MFLYLESQVGVLIWTVHYGFLRLIWNFGLFMCLVRWVVVCHWLDAGSIVLGKGRGMAWRRQRALVAAAQWADDDDDYYILSDVMGPV